MKLTSGYTFIYGNNDYDEYEMYTSCKYKVYRYTGHQDMSMYFLFSESKNNISKIFHAESSREVDDNLIKHLLGIDL